MHCENEIGNVGRLTVGIKTSADPIYEHELRQIRKEKGCLRRTIHAVSLPSGALCALVLNCLGETVRACRNASRRKVGVSERVALRRVMAGDIGRVTARGCSGQTWLIALAWAGLARSDVE